MHELITHPECALFDFDCVQNNLMTCCSSFGNCNIPLWYDAINILMAIAIAVIIVYGLSGLKNDVKRMIAKGGLQGTVGGGGGRREKRGRKHQKHLIDNNRVFINRGVK